MVPYRFTQSFLVNVTAEPRPRCVVTMTTVGYGDKVWWWWVGMSWLWPTCFPKCGGFLWKFYVPQVDELFLGLVEVVEGLQGTALSTTVQAGVKVLKEFMIWRCWHIYKNWHTIWNSRSKAKDTDPKFWWAPLVSLENLKLSFLFTENERWWTSTIKYPPKKVPL